MPFKTTKNKPTYRKGPPESEGMQVVLVGPRPGKMFPVAHMNIQCVPVFIECKSKIEGVSLSILATAAACSNLTRGASHFSGKDDRTR